MSARRPSGEAFEYSSVNTFVLRWLVERVTGKPYAEVVAEEIWAAMGAESDALIVAPIRGVPIASSGISSTLRDVSRFGFLFTPSGRAGVKPLVSDQHLQHIQAGGRPEIFAADREDGPRRVNGEAALTQQLPVGFCHARRRFFQGWLRRAGSLRFPVT